MNAFLLNYIFIYLFAFKNEFIHSTVYQSCHGVFIRTVCIFPEISVNPLVKKYSISDKEIDSATIVYYL